MSTPFHETIDLTLCGKMGRIHRLCRTAVTAAVEPLGLTECRWTAMIHLAHLGEGPTQQMLAHSLDIEMPSLTRTLKQLEQAEIIERRVDEHDKRSRKLYFTDAGLILLEQLKQIIVVAKKRLYRNLSDEQLDMVAHVLLKIEENALQCQRQFNEEQGKTL